MHTTYVDQDGWLPIIGVRVERLSELLFFFFVIAIAVILLVYLLPPGRKILLKIIKPLGILLLGAVVHIGLLSAEMAISTYHIVLQIPLSWYPVTALTVIPFAVDIPRQAAVWFLLAYCVVNAVVVVYGIEVHDDKKEKEKINEKQAHKEQLHVNADQIQSQLFAGLRISIQQ